MMKTPEEIAQFFAECSDFCGSVKMNENLSKHTTMNVGGAAKIFLEPKNEESLIFALNWLKNLDAETRRFTRINDFFILGGGSNVIISDKGLDAVISTRKLNRINRMERINKDIKNPSDPLNPCASSLIIEISSGSSWGSVISFCRKNDLGGFEAFTGLSGTVGGAIFMNATCFALTTSDNLLSVRYFDLEDGEIHEYEKNPNDWGYKKSPFQFRGSFNNRVSHKSVGARGIGSDPACGGKTCETGFERVSAKAMPEPLPPFVILSAKFSVTHGFDSQKSENCLSSRKEKGHFRAPSAGSAFKNDSEHGIIAGKVIDECGLKGFSVGGAQIAPWHGNFIINPERKATAGDIKALSDQVKKIVFEKTGIKLENEILFVE